VTSVAANSTCMAADTQLTGPYTARVQKLVRLPNGGIAGGCGHWAKAWRGLQWLAGGEEGDAPSIKGADILILQPDGSLWVAEGCWPAYPLLDKIAAVGCGAPMAMGLMTAGQTPIEAVKAVCKLDAYTGDPVQALSLEPKPARKARK
jgi:hypothetical protein